MPSQFTPLHAEAASVVAGSTGVPAADVHVEIAPRAELGDLAVNCFSFAKARGNNPVSIAQQIASAFRANPWLNSAEAAGPFVNFRANRPEVFRWLTEAAVAGTLLPRSLGVGQTIVVDYSSPNVSKQLAYHHIRSTMIGHSLVQIFRALGYTVIGLNHLGDWGTTHGKLIAAWKLWGPIEPLDITALNDLYVRFGQAAQTDPSLEDLGRAWFKKLEDGDPEAQQLWKRFYDISMAEYAGVYDMLGVTFDVVKGESEYLADVPRVLTELADKRVSSESQGALVVELPDEKTPLILRKSDGATTYATRDIPSADYRWNTWHFARSLYVVDRGQSLHFRQLFKTLAAMGRPWASRCEHIPFGLVQIIAKSKDGTGEAQKVKAGTRSGNVVLLRSVVAEAETRVRALLAEIHPELTGDALAKTASEVGTGAVVFANLASQRDKDVAFDWDRVIALQGDSGPYLQYSHARCAAIMRKAGNEPPATVDLTPHSLSGSAARPGTAGAIDYATLTHDNEWAVARKLLAFPGAVVAATPKCEPHIICHYLLELAGEFSRWYTAGNGDAALRVLCDDVSTRRARLALVAAVKAVLREGLSLLGIAAPDQM